MNPTLHLQCSPTCLFEWNAHWQPLCSPHDTFCIPFAPSITRNTNAPCSHAHDLTPLPNCFALSHNTLRYKHMGETHPLAHYCILGKALPSLPTLIMSNSELLGIFAVRYVFFSSFPTICFHGHNKFHDFCKRWCPRIKNFFLDSFQKQKQFFKASLLVCQMPLIRLTIDLEVCNRRHHTSSFMSQIANSTFA